MKNRTDKQLRWKERGNVVRLPPNLVINPTLTYVRDVWPKVMAAKEWLEVKHG